MSFLKKTAVLLTAAGVWWGAGPSFVFGQARRPPLPWEPFTAVVDGRIRTGLGTVAVEGVPCLSLRDIQRLFGGRQSWQRISRRVQYEIHGRRAEFLLDSSTAAVSGAAVSLETPVRWWTGHVYIPLSLVLTPEFQNMCEASVHWDAASRSLTVDPVPSVSSPRLYSYPGKSRVVVELGPRVHYRVMGYRDKTLSVRFFGGRSLGREKLEIKDGLLDAVQLVSRGRSSDLTLTLANGAPKVTFQESPRQLIVDVLPPEAAPAENIPEAPEEFPQPPDLETALPETEEAEPLPAPEPASPLLALSPLKTVVIDPGHGGKDAGAVGAHGTLEKDVNLQVARALARLLKREGRFRVIMTRNDDTFIPLEERTEIANKHKADLFVSIHCNAAISRRSRGFEIYFLSEKATDEAAAAVARRENAVVELEGVSGKAKQKLQELLWSLARTETMNESSEIAALISRQVGQRAGVPNRGVKQAAFYVLRGANMPAVLVESGFITHPREEGLLRSGRFHKKLVDAVYAGILDYEKRKIRANGRKSAAGETASVP